MTRDSGAHASDRRRRLGTVGATGIGVGSMLGAGVFVVWSPAAASAGGLLVVAVVVAAVVAALNAWSTARLAVVHPVAGGAYTYGVRELASPWGFVAGWGFVVGKTASVAAMALAIGNYVWPSQAPVIATVAIAGSWILNARGVTRTAAATTVIASAVVAGLVAVATASFAGDAVPAVAAPQVGIGGVLEAAALLFFAFAGYARLATLGEEVRAPERTIPRAMAAAFAIVVTLYVVLAVAVMRRPGPAALAESSAPLADAAGAVAPWTWALATLATAAAGGAMVALMAGMGRTTMAMAREGDAPGALATTNLRGVPARAEAVVAGAAIVLAWWGNLSLALAVSSGAVLVYYAVAHAAAFAAARRLSRRAVTRAVTRAVALVGGASCLALVASLPIAAAGATLGVLAVGVLIRAVARR